jgi:ketosteroid isomerase-like protein
MSQNVDLVRSIYADWERGDYSSAQWADPEIEFVIVDGPDPGNWSGLVAVAEAWRNFLQGIEDPLTTADEYRELDDERVLVPTRYSGRGKVSDMDIEGRGTILFHIREGRVMRIVRYWDPERALADLGLAE